MKFVLTILLDFQIAPLFFPLEFIFSLPSWIVIGYLYQTARFFLVMHDPLTLGLPPLVHSQIYSLSPHDPLDSLFFSPNLNEEFFLPIFFRGPLASLSSFYPGVPLHSFFWPDSLFHPWSFFSCLFLIEHWDLCVLFCETHPLYFCALMICLTQPRLYYPL